jgi:hypothetical protein
MSAAVALESAPSDIQAIRAVEVMIVVIFITLFSFGFNDVYSGQQVYTQTGKPCLGLGETGCRVIVFLWVIYELVALGLIATLGFLCSLTLSRGGICGRGSRSGCGGLISGLIALSEDRVTKVTNCE